MHSRISCGSLWLGLVLGTLFPAVVQAQPDPDAYNALLDNWLEADKAGRYRDAERYARQIKAIDEQFKPGDLSWQLFLGVAFNGQGRYKEAQPLMESYVKYVRRKDGEAQTTVEGLFSLGAIYQHLQLLDDAQRVLEEAVSMGRRALGPQHASTLNAQGNLALLYQLRGELQRAAKLFREVIDAQYRSGEVDPDRLIPIMNLVMCYLRMGRYDQAESMARYGLDLAHSMNASIENPRVLMLVHNLAGTYVAQNRAAEARPLLEGILRVAEKVLGENHPEIGLICGELASCYMDLDEREKGISTIKRAIEVLAATLGPENPSLCVQYFNLGWLYINTHQPQEAEKILRKALQIVEKSAGASNWQTAQTRVLLADALLEQDQKDKDAEAERLLKQALTDLEVSTAGEYHRHEAMRSLSRLLWKRDERPAAIKQLQEALDLADASRAHFGGGDVERATASTNLLATYDLMLAWQVQSSNVAGAFETIERARARTFLESMNMAGVDLRQGMTAEARAESIRRESELNSLASKLEDDLSKLPAPVDKEDSAMTQRRKELSRALFNARDELYKFQRDLRSNSAMYRKLIAASPKPPALADVQKQLVPKRSLLLSYAVGSERSYLLIIRPEDASLVELKFSEQHAQDLGVSPGPLNHKSLQQILLGESQTAILPRLAKRDPIDDLLPKLHALWQVLFPEELRKEISAEALDRLIILPDGALALLPFEALVVQTAPELKYLLDIAPPIQYGPSAAVLMSLAARPAVRSTQQPVLTLGDPQYGRPQNVSPQGNLVQLAARGSRASTIRQQLVPLPNSGLESRWVAEVFKKAGADSVQLLGANATEAQVRANIRGREIIHLACHGTSDDAYGNYFGMLAVAPGTQAGNSQDDGMLTLAEIFGLDLRGCELAILSACMTNHGPEQRGEGVWALSRGFLVAGARRAIASDWVVDDEAGASLISVCCSQLADARKNQQAADYSRALRKAKLWVRQQDKWSSPYFWAPFVLVGPN